MQIGMMNDPDRDAVEEARWAAVHGFEFLDLTVEGPGASVDQLNVAALRAVLDEHNMGIVGHTPWYLPFASPIPQLRAGAIAAVVATFEPLVQLGAKLVNVHVDRGVGRFGYDDNLRWNGESFAQLAEQAKPFGLRVMVENVVNQFNTAKAMCAILEAHPDLLFHLDIAHANVRAEQTQPYLRSLRHKLAHVHISDNRLRDDDHLPLGVGAIDWPSMIRLLKKAGYDGTITLEVFAADRGFLLDSVSKVRQLWESTTV